MKKQMQEFSRELWNGNTLVIYGAGKYGKFIGNGLIKLGIDNFIFCDKSRTGTLCKKEIIKPENINDYPNSQFIVSSIGYGYYMVQTLHSFGINDTNIFLAVGIRDLGDDELSLEIEEEKRGFLCLKNFDLVVTQKCSLKCEKCSNLMQYYQNPLNCSDDVTIASLHSLCDAIKHVDVINILGGEPFVNQPLVTKILEEFRDEHKIGLFRIISNGTIVPGEECLKAMSDTPRLTVRLSNYGEVSRHINEAKKKFEKYGIDNTIFNLDGEWIDEGDLKDLKHSEDYLQYIYHLCGHCNTLMDGKYYVCPRQAHGVALGAVPLIEGEYVDMIANSDGSATKQLIGLIRRKNYISTCRFCDGPCGKKITKAAVQTRHPLQYEKYAK